MIEITWSKAYVLNSGGDLSKIVEIKIVVGLMRFIVLGLLAGQGPNNIIGRGYAGTLRNIFGVDLQLAVPRTRQLMNFCIAHSERDMVFTPTIDIGSFFQAWVVASQMLGVLIVPVDQTVDSNDRTCPWCLEPILSWIFGIPLCGHPMNMRCWREYHALIHARGGTVKCPKCNYDTCGCFI
jgi:hypothetical protein